MCHVAMIIIIKYDNIHDHEMAMHNKQQEILASNYKIVTK